MLLDKLVPVNQEKKDINIPAFEETKAAAKEIHVRVYNLRDVKQAIDANADVIYYDAFATDLQQAIKLAGSAPLLDYISTPLYFV